MKKFIRGLSYVIIALVFSVALSGCKKSNPTEPRDKEIIVWSFEDEDVWKPIAKDFATKYKGYKVTYKKQTFDSEYENRVMNSIMSDEGPDVWAMPNDWVYRHKDKLANVTKKTVNPDKFVDSIKQSVVFDDKIYALSSYSEPLMVYYNPQIFDETLSQFNRDNKGSENTDARREAARLLKGVPGTWSDFVETVKLLTKKDEGDQISLGGVAMGTAEISNAADLLYLLMFENETKIVSDDFKQAVFNLPVQTATENSETPGLRALEFYTSFSDPDSENYTWDDSMGNDIEAFAEGKVAMIFGYSTLQNYLAQKYPTFRYRRAFIPQLTSDSSKVVDYARFNALGVAKLANQHGGLEKISACWNLVNYVSTGASANSFNSALKVHTSQKSSDSFSFDDRNTNNPEKISLFTAKSLVKGRYPTEFDNLIKNSITAVNEGTQDPQSALDSAAKDANELLRKAGW